MGVNTHTWPRSGEGGGRIGGRRVAAAQLAAPGYLGEPDH